MTEVVRVTDPYDIRIDRLTKWGNPFVIGRDGTREEVIEKYRGWLWEQIHAGSIGLDELAELDGKRLACHCAPERCHGEVLSEAAEWAARTLTREDA